MNVGIITSWFERGAAYVSRNFMEGLQRHGHDVFIFARGGECYSHAPDWHLPNVYYSSSRMGTCSRCRYTGIADLDEFNHWLDAHHIQVAMFNEQMDPLPMVECRQRGVKTVFFGIGLYVLPIDFYRSHFDVIIAHTRLFYDIFEPTGIAHLVPWGVVPESFSSQGKNLTSDAVIFFHNAGMSFANLRKGTHHLIKAWHHLPQRDKKVAQLIIHSQLDPDVLYRSAPWAQDMIDQEENLELHIGTVDQSAGYHRGNVYVYPASCDGIGLTITEAMACGMPIITADAQPFNEFVNHNDNGLLVRARKRAWSHTLGETGNRWGWYDVSVRDLTEKLRYFIHHRDRISQMGLRSRELVEETFNFWKNFETFESLLQKS